jgi:hypothetical protein
MRNRKLRKPGAEIGENRGKVLKIGPELAKKSFFGQRFLIFQGEQAPGLLLTGI